MLLTARTALFIVKSLSACRERLLKQQYLNGNLFVQGNLQRETRELGKTAVERVWSDIKHMWVWSDLQAEPSSSIATGVLHIQKILPPSKS